MQVNTNNKKPTIHIAADSISMHYGPYLESLVKNQLIVDRKPEETAGIRHETGTNGGDSGQLLIYLKLCKKLDYHWDFLLLNACLHDIRRRSGELQVEFSQYALNVEEIFVLSQQLADTPIWVRSTPVIDSLHNSIKNDYHRHNDDVERCNKIADEIAHQKKVPTIDLYKLTEAVDAKQRHLDHIHFTEEVRLLQGGCIAGWLAGFSVITKAQLDDRGPKHS